MQQRARGILYKRSSHRQPKGWEWAQSRGNSSSPLFPNPLSMETYFSKIGLRCDGGCYYSKEPELTCQFVTECIWSCTWGSKRASRLLRSCVISEMELFLLLSSILGSPLQNMLWNILRYCSPLIFLSGKIKMRLFTQEHKKAKPAKYSKILIYENTNLLSFVLILTFSTQIRMSKTK